MQPVRGTVKLPDGKPAVGSQVVFEGGPKGEKKKTTARGDVRDDGTFVLGTGRPGEGVPPGEYQVQVNPPPVVNVDVPYVSPFNPKYSNFSTSGLEFEVKRGQKNEFEIKTTK